MMPLSLLDIGEQSVIKKIGGSPEVKKHLENLEKDYPGVYEIRTFEPNYKKCEEYCSCCKFCKYYQEKYMKGDE